MIVMTTGLTGLMALMRQDEKASAPVERRPATRLVRVSDGLKARVRPG
jgi:hypothetical protein